MEQFLIDSEDEDEPGIPKQSEPKTKTILKGWDKATLEVADDETQALEDEKCYLILLKSLKILAYIVTFILTLGGAVTAKASLLLMTSQLKPERRIPFCAGKYQKLETHPMPLEVISWTWAIFFCYVFPELLSFIRALRIWMFKPTSPPTFFQFMVPAFFETCHTFGLSLLAFVVLPSLNVLQGAMLTNTLCVVPILFSLLSRTPSKNSQTGVDAKAGRNKWIVLSSVDATTLLCVATGFILWGFFNDDPVGMSWMLPLAAILTSFGWWENYADRTSFFRPIRFLGNLQLSQSRYTTNLFLAFWKIFIFGLGMVFGFWFQGYDHTMLFSDFEAAFQKHLIQYSEIRAPIANDTLPVTGGDQFYGLIHTMNNYPSAVVYAISTQVISALVTYLAGKFACKIGIQSFSFAFPLNLVVPVTLVTLNTLCGLREKDTCVLNSIFAPYLFWECAQGNLFQDFILGKHGWVWFLWLVAQTWTTIHIWDPKFRRMERGEVLFVSPMYSGLIVDQSLTMNRRRKEVMNDWVDDEDYGEMEDTSEPYRELRSAVDFTHEDDTVPKIFACATMWHEIKSEMSEMLKSIFRLDDDQATRRIARRYFAVQDPDYYELETHIFFDDAFAKDGNDVKVNSYVKDLLDSMEDAASHVHETMVHLAPPKKYPTPYGGRLEWTLPGGTKFYVHLKNKDKIRHKKRWSQVMYMYYFLGHRLLERDIPVSRKELIGENTFLLALDGDIDFKPQAVRLLVDLMKKNKSLGAACGRIHPIGSGLMVWYQKFEYAIGHWFQKATEHVIGCVLCSPGCFSLFRGKALLDKNVMAKYTTKATEPRHFVQYDQGEDRWLCTLLLQQGYRVEYSAASDALTHCPEQFGEFFTQRRRWVPSTMANIIDLLVDYKRTIRTNPDISSPYIAYQMLMMVGSILGPGTIFLMLIGAFNSAFKISNFDSFIWNVIPVAVFLLVCFFASQEVQLLVAQIMAAGYALVMVAVLVALLIQIQDDGPFAPTSLFLFAVSLSFIIAAILHPLEFGCLPFGIVYYITIPAMYLLLIIYSLMNLNIVSWGTREVAEVVSPEQAAAADLVKKQEAANNSTFGAILSYFTPKSKEESEGSFEISFAGLFKLMCCTKPVDDDKYQLTQIAASLSDINKRLDGMERISAGSIVGVPPPRFSSGNSTTSARIPDHAVSIPMETAEDFADSASVDNVPVKVETEKRNDLVNPKWIEDPDLKKGDVDYLTGIESTFWRELIDKYLLPLEKDPVKEKKIAADLIELRNKTIYSFLMVNAVFVVAIFLLQSEKETLFIEWPLGATYNMSYTVSTFTAVNNINIQQNPLKLEPIGVMFVFVFALILIIQFTAMLIHRFGTFCHILASTMIDWCARDVNAVAKESALEKEGLSLIRKLQKLKNKHGDVTGRKSRTTMGDVARRKTIHNLEKDHDVDQKPANIENTFKTTFAEVSQAGDKQEKFLRGGRQSRVTFQQLARRRSTVLERRQSTVTESMRKSVNTGTGGGGGYESNAIGSAIPYQRARNGGGGGVSYKNSAYIA